MIKLVEGDTIAHDNDSENFFHGMHIGRLIPTSPERAGMEPS